MGYKQPGFGNGEKAPIVHSSPLNIRRRKKMESSRGERDAHKVTGVKKMKSQYAGMSPNQIMKAKAKARKKAEKFEKKAIDGKKLTKRQQSFIDERDYNKKYKEQAKTHSEAKKAIDKEYGKSKYGKSLTQEQQAAVDQDRINKAADERATAEADASANRFRDPGLVASEKRDPAETNMPDIDVVEKKPKSYYSDTKLMNRDRTKQVGHRVDWKESELKDMRFAQKPNKYGLTPSYNQKGEIEYSQNVPQWITDSGNKEEYEKWKAQMDANMTQRDKDYEAQFGSDYTGERDYTMLEGYNTHTNRTKKQKNKETWKDYASGNLSEGEMAYRSESRRKAGWRQGKDGLYTIPPKQTF